MVKINNQSGYLLDDDVIRLIEAQFRQHYRVVVKAKFAHGESGGLVFLVRTLLRETEAELPSVIKIDFFERISEEWEAYQRYVQYRLPDGADIRGEPVYIGQKGLLWYSLVGSGVFETAGFYDYWMQACLNDVEAVLGRLFRSLGCLWRQSQMIPEVSLAEAYDSILPVNLTIEQVAGLSKVSVLTPTTVHQREWRLGEEIGLGDLKVAELERDSKCLVLNFPAGVAGAYRIRVENVVDVNAYRVGEVLGAPIWGVIRQTRMGFLRSQAQTTVVEEVDLTQEELVFANDLILPNPLNALERYLRERVDMPIAYIHGDLNLDNILVDMEYRLALLIDFARAQRNHLFQDFLRLEMNLIVRIFPQIIQDEGLAPEIVVLLYRRLYRALGQFQPAPPPLGLEKLFAALLTLRRAAAHYLIIPNQWEAYNKGLIISFLGALKFRLDDYATAPIPKQVAFLAAAAIEAINQDTTNSWRGDSAVSEEKPTATAGFWLGHVKDSEPRLVLGQHYLSLQVQQIQLAALDTSWEGVELAKVTIQLDLNYPALTSDPVIVAKEQSVSFGNIKRLAWQPVLVDLVPAVMSYVTVNVVIDDMVSGEMIESFQGNFHVFAGVEAGMYVLLNRESLAPSLASDDLATRLRFCDGRLYWDDEPIEDVSYVILQLSSWKARTRVLGTGTAWDRKFSEAEGVVENVEIGLVRGKAAIDRAWDRCVDILREARLLLRDDPRYLPREKDSIYKTVAIACRDGLQTEPQTRLLKGYRGQLAVAPEIVVELNRLGLDPYEDLEAALTDYAFEVAKTRRMLRKNGRGKAGC